LPCYTWHMIPNTGTCHAIFDIWYPISVLAMLSLDTWYLTPYIWHLTINMLSLDTWHMLSPGSSTLDLILWHLTGYYYTWHLYYMVYSWLSLLRGLGMIIILLSNLWYSWTPVLMYSWTPVLLNSWTPVLLNSCIPCTHVPCTVTLVNSTVRPASGRACLVSRWRGCIPQSC